MFFATGDDKDSESSTSSIQQSQPCREFEYPEILKATEDFAESLVIGKGGFGKVYKGYVINGSSLIVAAIKRLDSMSNQGEVEFWAEVEMLSMLRHCNLVSLIGYCNYEKEKILVYEYMPNGTLNDHLHNFSAPLSWLQRLNICIGAGRGLHYLHTGTGILSGVIHRDVKSSNILLHDSWAAKISDFGLSKIGPTNQPSTYVNTLIKGTFGYLDPDYFATGRLTRKSDVYAFGVVLLEVLCRKLAVDRSLDVEQWSLAAWAQESIKEGNLKRIIDSDIRGEISPKCLKVYVKTVERCLHNNPKHRPTMAEVVVSLESGLTLQEKFLKPAGRTMFGRMRDMLSFPSNQQSSQIITTEPLPCDQSNLPVYSPSKELDAMYREEEGRRYINITSSPYKDKNDPCDPSDLPVSSPSKEFDAIYREEEAKRLKTEAMKGHVPEFVRMGAEELSTQSKAHVPVLDLTSRIYQLELLKLGQWIVRPPEENGKAKNRSSYYNSKIHKTAVGTLSNTHPIQESTKLGDGQRKETMGYGKKISKVYSGPSLPQGESVEDLLKNIKDMLKQQIGNK